MVEGVSVIGLGYVGLTFAACLASRGLKVIGVEVDEAKRRLIAEGVPPIYEEGLEPMLRKVVKEGRLSVTGDYGEAVRESDVSFISVGTPSRSDGSVDLRYVVEAARSLGKALKEKSEYHLVVVRSTVPPGTTRGVVGRILEEESGRRVGNKIGLCFNPEFLREGKAVQDTFNPDRLVVGCVDERSREILLRLYERFYGGRLPPLLATTPVNAELIKYASNAFLAMKISYANMLAQLCEKIPGADVKVVAKGVGMDRRIGEAFLGAGLGWGGSCFPKDVRALLAYGREKGVRLSLLEATVEVNEQQLDHALELAEKLVGGLRGRVVAVLGLAFKPGTDDIRESRAIRLVEKLLERGARVRVHDPKALEKARRVLGERVEYAESVEACLRGSELAVLATEWPEYGRLDSTTLRRLMHSPALLDCRRLYPPERFRDIRFAAIGLGGEAA